MAGSEFFLRLQTLTVEFTKFKFILKLIIYQTINQVLIIYFISLSFRFGLEYANTQHT